MEKEGESWLFEESAAALNHSISAARLHTSTVAPALAPEGTWVSTLHSVVPNARVKVLPGVHHGETGETVILLVQPAPAMAGKLEAVPLRLVLR